MSQYAIPTIINHGGSTTYTAQYLMFQMSPYSLRRVTSFWGSGSIPVISWLIILMNLDIYHLGASKYPQNCYKSQNHIPNNYLDWRNHRYLEGQCRKASRPAELHGLKVLARQNPQQRILQPSGQVQQPSQLNGGRQGHQLVAGGGGQVTWEAMAMGSFRQIHASLLKQF